MLGSWARRTAARLHNQTRTLARFYPGKPRPVMGQFVMANPQYVVGIMLGESHAGLGTCAVKMAPPLLGMPLSMPNLAWRPGPLVMPLFACTSRLAFRLRFADTNGPAVGRPKSMAFW